MGVLYRAGYTIRLPSGDEYERSGLDAFWTCTFPGDLDAAEDGARLRSCGRTKCRLAIGTGVCISACPLRVLLPEGLDPRVDWSPSIDSPAAPSSGPAKYWMLGTSRVSLNAQHTRCSSKWMALPSTRPEVAQSSESGHIQVKMQRRGSAVRGSTKHSNTLRSCHKCVLGI